MGAHIRLQTLILINLDEYCEVKFLNHREILCLSLGGLYTLFIMKTANLHIPMWRAQPSYWSKLLAMSVVFRQSLLLLQKSSLLARFGNSLCFGCVALWSLVLLTFSKLLWSVGTISLISSTRFFLLLVGWLFFNLNFLFMDSLGFFHLWDHIIYQQRKLYVFFQNLNILQLGCLTSVRSFHIISDIKKCGFPLLGFEFFLR